MLRKKCFIVVTSEIQRFQTLCAMCTEVWNKHHMCKENYFHWLCTTVVYQQIENSKRANQIHRFKIDHCKFILKTINKLIIIQYIFLFPFTGKWQWEHMICKKIMVCLRPLPSDSDLLQVIFCSCVHVSSPVKNKS